MKTIVTLYKKFPAEVLSMTSLLLFSSCFSPAEEGDEELESTSPTTLRVMTRAITGSIPYPVLLLAYDASGSLKAQQTLNDASENISMPLNEGSYHITAIAGQDGLVLPDSYEQSSASLSMPNVGSYSQPLMMGGADVVLSEGAASVSIVLTYRVAMLTLLLEDIPSDVTAVTLGVSQQYGAIDMMGTLSGTSIASVPCSWSDEGWKSDSVYVFPGSGSSTTLTLSLSNASGQTSYSYELGEALAAAVPYNITGTYVESSVPYITGVLTSEGWKSQQNIGFNFGSGNSSASAGKTVPTMEVSSLPSSGSAWNGHAVALVQNATDTEEDLLLLSLAEQTDVHAPAALGYETEMSSLVSAYSEGLLSDWSVPTEAEARLLKTAYAGNYDDFNTVLESLNGTLLSTYSTSNNARFLCESGTKTFNFAANGSINNAGSTVKYRLRLVKTVHVKKSK